MKSQSSSTKTGGTSITKSSPGGSTDAVSVSDVASSGSMALATSTSLTRSAPNTVSSMTADRSISACSLRHRSRSSRLHRTVSLSEA
eukprot:2235594-Prymnesium_polylepis.1